MNPSQSLSVMIGNTIRLAVGCLVILCANQVQSAELRLMTFNVKGDAAELFDLFEAARSWRYFDISDPTNPLEGPGRRDRAISVIEDFGPDILSVQELKTNQKADLLGAFPGMSFYGQGRRGGELDDANGIFFRSSRFDLVDQGDFWLSENPETPGTSFFGNGTDDHNPRMATWVKLHDQNNGQTYFVLSTHWSLDHTAREQSAELIQSRLPTLAGDLPILLLGDLNTTQTSLAYRTLRGIDDPNAVVLADSFTDAGGSNGRTFHNWNGGTSGSRIDHLFHSPDDFTATTAGIVRDTFENGYYPSDHYPVFATLTVIPEPTGTVAIVTALCLFASSRPNRSRRQYGA